VRRLVARCNSLVLASLLLFTCLPAAAQRRPAPGPAIFPPETVAELRQLQQAALSSDYAWRQLAHLTENIGPRPAGSPQAQAAVEYVAAELRRLGLEVRLEKVTVPHWVRGEETAALVEYPGQAPDATQKIVLTALGGSVATPPEGLTADVVVVSSFDELRALGRDQVAGRIVLFNVPFDKQTAAVGFGGAAYGQAVVYRSAGPTAAARLGAAACLIRSVGGADYRLPHTGATGYASDVQPIPAAAVTAEDAVLLDHLARQGRVRMHLLLTPRRLPDVESYNVVADLKGSEQPEKVVIVSGHLDSWDLATGALDDAAGVAVAMQAAQLIKQLGLRPKRTLRVIAWMDEELTFSGPRAYAQAHAKEMGAHFAAIESDLGAGHPVGIDVRADQRVVALLRQVGSVLQGSGAGIVRPSPFAGSDISVLATAGVPTFSPIQDERFYFNYHHTAADTLDKVNPHELQENAAIMVVLAYALTNIPQELPR
jgi:carboxypeptidase Q